MQPLLEVRSLTKRYGAQVAVHRLSFSMRKGEIVGFLGPNGAGKSTTMKIITGFLPADEGEVFLMGRSLYDEPQWIKKNIGYLPENNPLYLDMYVEEFLRFIADLYRIPKREKKQRIEEVIAMVGLTPERHKPVGALSKGYRQRVGLAQALLPNPLLLILDEPTSGLDPNQVIEIRQLIKNLGKERTILFSSHILSEVEAIADRVLLIHKGKLLLDTPMNQLSIDEPRTIIVEMEQPGFDLKPIKRHPDVIKVERINETKFKITTQKDKTLRKWIYQESVRQGIPLLALQLEDLPLEVVFRKLTQRD